MRYILSSIVSLMWILLPLGAVNTVESVIPRLEEMIKEQMKAQNIPGCAIVIVADGKVQYLQGFGVANTETGGTVDGKTQFQLASVSKPITATLLAQLVEKDKLSWDAPIHTLDPDFSLADPWVTHALTLQDLLSHRSGLPDHGGDLLEDLNFSKEEVYKRLQKLPLAPFRSTYAYSNMGFSQGAFAVAKQQGTSFETLARRELFEPLGMKNTTTSYASFKQSTHRADLHVLKEGKAVPLYQRNADIQAPAGGISSTVEDLAKWMLFVLDADKKEVQRTQTPMIQIAFDREINRGVFYGTGWNVQWDEQGRKRVSHSGAFALGARTLVTLFPEENVGLAILTNLFPTGFPEALSANFFDLLFNNKEDMSLFPLFNQRWEEMIPSPRVYPAPSGDAEPPLPLKRYIAEFTNEYFGAAAVELHQGVPTLILGPNREKFPLRHLRRDTFVYRSRGENSLGDSEVIFSFDHKGKVREMYIDDLNHSGYGHFNIKK